MRRTTIHTDEGALFDFPLGPASESTEPAATTEPTTRETETRRARHRPRESSSGGPEREPADPRSRPARAGSERLRTGPETGHHTAATTGGEPEPLPLFGPAEASDLGAFDLEEPGHERPLEAGAEPAGLLARRVVAGLIDVAVAGVALGALVTGVALMGLSPRLWQAPAYSLVLALFSFLYLVLSLAFWGQTPGMAQQRIRARTDDGHPLTFGQAGLRWLGGTATVLLLGLPTLLALRDGGSLADRMSGTELVEVRRDGSRS
ncbi:MAG: RDD family protein [Thermoanaerobaculia bacterium]|nr:RDD family protein [Thermoanaerobaculia bacterium]